MQGPRRLGFDLSDINSSLSSTEATIRTIVNTMRSLLSLTCLLLLAGTLSVHSAFGSRFQKQSGLFTGTPSKILSKVASAGCCAVLCSHIEPENYCRGFNYENDGSCSMFTARQLSNGTVSLAPEDGSPAISYRRTVSSEECADRSWERLANRVNYADAEQQCAALGGHLVVPLSPAENQCAIDLAAGASAWIGLNDRATEGEYLRADGQGALPVEEGFWADGEPNDTDYQDCVQIWHVSGVPRGWDDANCSTENFPLCHLSN